MALPLALLGGCGGNNSVAPSPTETAIQVQDQPASVAPASTKDLASARKDALANWKQVTLPGYAPPAPVAGDCRTTVCEANRVQLERNDWPKAWRGSYQGQRNVAFCRSNGCDGAAIIDKVEACAWRQVISSTHEGKVDDTDASNLQIDCGGLIQGQLDVAMERAGVMARTIVWKGTD
ncbi:hypothetical protein [Novosphingobium sp. SG751A]|uniref:hypothetical protein n=1 Tax=Novosphingobium sp. SG751A TaxID=2587000 RepID=UPI00155825C8|nr:hypothetical protein [Novosphingobium sp. SG751A]